MARYSIHVLGESQISISGGAQLDGVTQGDGHHLLGHQITLNSKDWQEIRVRDQNAMFGDSDTRQRLDGRQDVDGTSYRAGTVVEAEYELTLTDGTNSWTAVGFNVNNSNPSYGTIEGLAFVGDDLPPAGVPLTVSATREGPNYDADDYAVPVCYAAGTQIATARGLRAIETLRPGDRVLTADSGAQVVRWVGSRPSGGNGPAAPVRIAAGVLGGARPVLVSQQHRILLRHPAAQILFGSGEVFVPAHLLVDGHHVRKLEGCAVTWCHLMLNRHEVIHADGLPAESLCSRVGESGFFSELADDRHDTGALARPCLKAPEARVLLAELTDRHRRAA